MTFAHAGDSHNHSLETLNTLYEYDDFMLSIRSVLDLGCGSGDDLVWWATRTTRDDVPMPLNIDCTGVDLLESVIKIKNHDRIRYQSTDFEGVITPYPKGYDILWSHDSFQYAKNPLQTLSQWWDLASPGGMLYICVPITQQIHRRQLDYFLPSGSYYHYSLVNLIHMLATCGWDCRSGFFRQSQQDSWLHAVVYKSEHRPLDPKTATWYQLSELKLVPESADRSIQDNGYLKQQDLVVPWLDRSLMSMTIR
jgi:SAM-dependent methyltransferase